ncbi:MAG TPA: AlpA family phage regulatory protein [Hyphomonas sp.]|nr:AlpA family phage regulatory protein [Hyphomonas sp.]
MSNERFITRDEVSLMVGLSKKAIRTREKAGTFPQPIPLSNRTRVYRESEVQAWMLAQVRAADARREDSASKMAALREGAV